MGERLKKAEHMTYENATNILGYCFKLGARNLTLLGGEPTLHKDLPQLVCFAKSIGYEKINIDTNGLSTNKLLLIDPKQLNYIRISLDGASEKTHDLVRGKGTFNKTIKSINTLVKNKYNIAITSTIFKFNIHEAKSILDLAEAHGIKLVNFHVFSEEGFGKNNVEWSLSPGEWINFYEYLETVKDEYNISIWYPPSWATNEKLTKFVNEGYKGCLGCTLDRLSIFPNGDCYVCSVLFDEPLNYAFITQNGLILNRNQNEFELFTNALFKANQSWLSGCPAEKILERNGKIPCPNNYISICRCWKSQI